jgi:hypothetical protein
MTPEQKAALDLAILNLKTHGDDQLLSAVQPLIEFYESRVLAERKQEPVAWRSKWKTGNQWTYSNSKPYCNPPEKFDVEPVFAHPTPDDARVVVDSYSLANDPDVTVQRVKQRDGTYLWAVRSGACCLNSSGEWEEEPMPSNRDVAFLSRCRFATADAAIDRAMQDKEPK